MKHGLTKMLCLLVLTMVVFVGCAPSMVLTVKKVPYQEPEVVRTRRYDPSKINSILVIQPASDRGLEQDKKKAEGTRKIVLASGKDEYVSYIETFLLKRGYTVISDDILGKIKQADNIVLQAGERLVSRAVELSPSELATKFGKKSGADAILKINKLKEKKDDHFYIYYQRAKKWEEMPGYESWNDEKRRLGEEGIKYYYYALSLKEFSIDVEVNDVETGNILAKGAAVLSTRNVMPEDYNVFFNKKGQGWRRKMNFQISKYVSLKTMDVQIKELITNVLSKMMDSKHE